MEGAGKLTIEVGNAFIDDAYACAHPEVTPGQYVMLAVTDTGIGMSDQEQTDLFTDYYRTRTALESDITGHGIGLALTHRIVRAHGGQISVVSSPGSGSTFTIRLPIGEDLDAPRASAPTTSGEGAPA